MTQWILETEYTPLRALYFSCELNEHGIKHTIAERRQSRRGSFILGAIPFIDFIFTTESDLIAAKIII